MVENNITHRMGLDCTCDMCTLGLSPNQAEKQAAMLHLTLGR